jgi:hypothetical protein
VVVECQVARVDGGHVLSGRERCWVGRAVLSHESGVGPHLICPPRIGRHHRLRELEIGSDSLSSETGWHRLAR